MLILFQTLWSEQSVDVARTATRVPNRQLTGTPAGFPALIIAISISDTALFDRSTKYSVDSNTKNGRRYSGQDTPAVRNTALNGSLIDQCIEPIREVGFR